MEDDPRRWPHTKINRIWIYGYPEWSKGDRMMEDDPRRLPDTKLTEIEVMGIQSDPRVIYIPLMEDGLQKITLHKINRNWTFGPFHFPFAKKHSVCGFLPSPKHYNDTHLIFISREFKLIHNEFWFSSTWTHSSWALKIKKKILKNKRLFYKIWLIAVIYICPW